MHLQKETSSHWRVLQGWTTRVSELLLLIISYRAFVIRLKEPLSLYVYNPTKNTENPKVSVLPIHVYSRNMFFFFIFHLFCNFGLVVDSVPTHGLPSRRKVLTSLHADCCWHWCWTVVFFRRSCVNVSVPPPLSFFFSCCALLHTEIEGIKKRILFLKPNFGRIIVAGHVIAF